MTAILWKDNALYVDSYVEKDGEWLNVNDKVIQVSLPARLNAPRSTQLSEGGEDRGYDDWIVGFTWTGARAPALAMMKLLVDLSKQTFPNPECQGEGNGYTRDLLIDRYNLVNELNLHNSDNDFTIFMIGVERNYVATMTSDAGFKVLDAPKDRLLAFGSGESHIKALDAKRPDSQPIRLMWHAFFMEASCGGEVRKFEVIANPGKPSKHQLLTTAIWHQPGAATCEVSSLICDSNVDPDLCFNPVSKTGKCVTRHHSAMAKHARTAVARKRAAARESEKLLKKPTSKKTPNVKRNSK